MALSLKYREVDQVLQKVLHGTEVHEERWVKDMLDAISTFVIMFRNVSCCELLLFCSKVHIRWRVCVTDVDNALGFALGVMFVNETFDKKTKPEAEKMIKLITKAFRWKQILIQIHFHFFLSEMVLWK